MWRSLASALGLGPRGRRFESCHPDFASLTQSGQSNGLLIRESKVRILHGALWAASIKVMLWTFNPENTGQYRGGLHGSLA